MSESSMRDAIDKVILNGWNRVPDLPAHGCVCMQAWNGVIGRTCPAHGYIAPMAVTC
jgi:hypothetical protein